MTRGRALTEHAGADRGMNAPTLLAGEVHAALPRRTLRAGEARDALPIENVAVRQRRPGARISARASGVRRARRAGRGARLTRRAVAGERLEIAHGPRRVIRGARRAGAVGLTFDAAPDAAAEVVADVVHRAVRAG